MEVYEPRYKTQPDLFTRILKIFVVFGISWLILFIPVGILVGLFESFLSVNDQNVDMDLKPVLWAAILTTQCYIVYKLKHNEILRIEFDDTRKVVNFSLRNYFLAFQFNKSVNYSEIRFESRNSKSILYGEYIHVSFKRRNKVIAVIGNSSVDWHKMPNAINLITRKIDDIIINYS